MAAISCHPLEAADARQHLLGTAAAQWRRCQPAQLRHHMRIQCGLQHPAAMLPRLGCKVHFAVAGCRAAREGGGVVHLDGSCGGQLTGRPSQAAHSYLVALPHKIT